MSTTLLDVDAVRRRFSSLSRGFAFFDAPGGTQVPDEVGEAMVAALRDASGNLGAPYATGERVAAILDEAKAAGAAFVGATPDEIAFGTNMTTLSFSLSRAFARDLKAGDEIVVTRLDHDANVAPWLELAEDRDLVVRLADVRDDTTLDYDALEGLLSDRTRVVAFPWASNAVGTTTDAARLCALAHEVGAIAWIDAVHYAAHEPIDVRAIDADVVLLSPYKLCGPHLGLAYGRAELLERLRPYKARPAPSEPVARRFETGTPPFELLAGFAASMRYVDSLGGIETLRAYERELAGRFLAGLPEAARLYGLPTLEGRVPTFLLNLEGVDAAAASLRLAGQGFGVWAHDTYYALNLYPRLPYDGFALRIGLFHYNTADEVDRLCAALAALAGE